MLMYHQRSYRGATLLMNHPYVPTKEDVWNIVSALELSIIIKDDLEISEVAVLNVSFSEV